MNPITEDKTDVQYVSDWFKNNLKNFRIDLRNSEWAEYFHLGVKTMDRRPRTRLSRDHLLSRILPAKNEENARELLHL